MVNLPPVSTESRDRLIERLGGWQPGNIAFADFIHTVFARLPEQAGLDTLLALTITDSSQSLATRSARLNLGLNGAGAVFAIGRNANNAGASYSGLQIGGGYAPDGIDGVIFAPDGHASWARLQPSKNLSPVELVLYPTLAQGFGSVVLGGNQITYVSGTSFTSFAVGKKIYIDEGVYLISINTGTVITVTTLVGGLVSFVSSATVVFHYGFITGSGTCSISGTAVTRIAGDPFIAFISASSFVFKTGGVARTVSSFTNIDHYVLSAGPGNTTSVSYNFEIDINDQITTFRLQKMIGSSEENLSIYARYDGYWISSLFAGSGEYRKIVIGSGQTAGALNRQIVIQKNGDLSFGGDYLYEAVRVLAFTGSPVNRIETQAAPTTFAVNWRARGADTNIGFTIDSKGIGNIVLSQDFTRTLAVFTASASAVNYPEFSSQAAGTGPFINAKGSDTNINIASVPKGTGSSQLRSGDSTKKVEVNNTGLGFFATAPVAKQSIAGSRGANAALADLLTKLAATGLIIDGTTI